MLSNMINKLERSISNESLWQNVHPDNVFQIALNAKISEFESRKAFVVEKGFFAACRIEQRLVFWISNQSSKNETKQTQQVEAFTSWNSGSENFVVIVVKRVAIILLQYT